MVTYILYVVLGHLGVSKMVIPLKRIPFYNGTYQSKMIQNDDWGDPYDSENLTILAQQKSWSLFGTAARPPATAAARDGRGQDPPASVLKTWNLLKGKFEEIFPLRAIIRVSCKCSVNPNPLA